MRPGTRFPLALTSPMVRGVAVRDAQRALIDNPYRRFYQGDVDGIYGEQTAHATRQAKYELGWEQREITDVYGHAIHEFLTGREKLSLVQKQRRKARLPGPDQKLRRVRALEAAESYIGTVERGTNLTEFGAWYGANGQPWCAMFVSYCGWKVGQRSFQPGHAYAYCPYVVNDARASRNGLSVTKVPEAGDLVLYDWQGDGTADHIGRFKEWASPDRSLLVAVEGNAQDAVRVERRNVADVLCYVRVAET